MIRVFISLQKMVVEKALDVKKNNLTFFYNQTDFLLKIIQVVQRTFDLIKSTRCHMGIVWLKGCCACLSL
jgi:hypothetical protein